VASSVAGMSRSLSLRSSRPGRQIATLPSSRDDGHSAGTDRIVAHRVLTASIAAMSTLEFESSFRFSGAAGGIASTSPAGGPRRRHGNEAEPVLQPLIRKLFAYTQSEWSPLAATFVEALQRLRWPNKTDGATAIPQRAVRRSEYAATTRTPR
jgi:hypothetical protein